MLVSCLMRSIEVLPHQARYNVNTFWRTGRGRCGYSLFADVVQARDVALRCEGGEQDIVRAAIEEEGLPTG